MEFYLISLESFDNILVSCPLSYNLLVKQNIKRKKEQEIGALLNEYLLMVSKLFCVCILDHRSEGENLLHSRYFLFPKNIFLLLIGHSFSKHKSLTLNFDYINRAMSVLCISINIYFFLHQAYSCSCA